MSETESQGTDFEHDASTTSTHESESPMTSDSETETDEDKDPWMPMVEEERQNHRTAFEETRRLHRRSLRLPTRRKWVQSGYLCTTPSTAQAGADAGISWS